MVYYLYLSYFPKVPKIAKHFAENLLYTANLFTVKTAGFHSVQYPIVVSMKYLQLISVHTGSLQSE